MADWIKCFFGFHDYSTWVENEETAGLGTHVYHSRACWNCLKSQYKR